MSSAAKLAANAANAQLSSGPRTEEGKAASSKNAMTHGLFARRDFIRPEEESDYAKLEADIQAELAPVGVIEQTLVEEIRRATWRLRRCGQVEANLVIRLENELYILDAMETTDARAEKIQKSVDRARSQAHRLLHKCMAELRKLQTLRESQTRTQLLPVSVTKQTQTPQPEAAKPHAVNPVTARNAACPCNSGLKYKRCCGQNAPPMLHAA